MKHTIDWARSGAIGLVFLVIGFGCGTRPAQDPKVVSTVRVEIAQPPPGPNQMANEAEPDTPAAARVESLRGGIDRWDGSSRGRAHSRGRRGTHGDSGRSRGCSASAPGGERGARSTARYREATQAVVFREGPPPVLHAFCSKTQWACEARRQTKSDHPGDVAPCHFTDAPPIMCRGKECFSVSDPDL